MSNDCLMYSLDRFYNTTLLCDFLPCIDGHVRSDSLVIQQSFNGTDYNQQSINMRHTSRDSKILIPQSFIGNTTNIFNRDGSNDLFNLLWRHASSSSDELTADVFSNRGCRVKRQQKRCAKLSLGSFNLGLSYRDGQSTPFLRQQWYNRKS